VPVFLNSHKKPSKNKGVKDDASSKKTDEICIFKDQKN
jgi:hypothetical protein